MSCCEPIDTCVVEDAPVLIMGRIADNDGNLITPASISSITWKVLDTADGSEKGSGSFVVASSVFASLQLDSKWVQDSVGYNFRATVPASAVPIPGVLMVEVKFTPAVGDIFYARWRLTVAELYGS